MTAEELPKIKAVLVNSKVLEPSASDEAVVQAHQMCLAGPSAAEYKAALEAQGVKVGPNWLLLIGLVGGAIGLYFVWKHYQTEEVDRIDRPDPFYQRHQLRGMSKALGAFRNFGGPKSTCSGRLGSPPKYEFEPERRLEGYRRRAPARRN